MNITVAICTWNRSALLTKTLENMLNLKSDDSFSWELLIVNNNSTDNTDQVIEQFSGRLPIKRIFETTPGLSNARNAAVRNASGDYIIWTDDDVLVNKDWLAAYVNAFRRLPNVAVFGGPISPWFEGDPPLWLKKGWKRIADAYAVRDLGNDMIPLTEEGNLLPYGANYALKMSEQIKYAYDPKLGLNAGKIIIGEESQVISAILNDGSEGRWIPDAKVHHWLPENRQTLDYLKKYYFGVGNTSCLKSYATEKGLGWKSPRWLIRQYLEASFAYFLGRVLLGPEKWLSFLSRYYITKGQMFGYKEDGET